MTRALWSSELRSCFEKQLKTAGYSSSIINVPFLCILAGNQSSFVELLISGTLNIWNLTKVICLRLFWKLSRMLNLDWNVDAWKKKKLFTWLFFISINFVDWWKKNWSMKENKNHNTSKNLIYSKIKMGCLDIQTADRITRRDSAFNMSNVTYFSYITTGIM